MARKVYRVSPDSNQWKVTHSGAVLSRHYTKAAAIEAGRTVALGNQPSQLVVHLANGQIETEWTYGDDPYPPKG